MVARNEKHNDDCQCEGCRDGLGVVAIRQRERMKTHGYYCHVVPDSPECPYGLNAHTHGFMESWSHPDIQIVLPMPLELISSIFSRLAGNVKEGIVYLADGTHYEGVIDDFDVRFMHATESGRDVLRLILPDEKGCLWDMEESFAGQLQA